jgi:trypsin
MKCKFLYSSLLGTTSSGGGSLPANLLKVTVPIVSRTTCRSQYGTSAITDRMICAGLPQGMSSFVSNNF